MRWTYLTFLLMVACASDGQQYQEPVFTVAGLAIKGYDPVAYFVQGTAVKGDQKMVLTWQGSKWLFSSQQNLALFKDNPQKYAPQYGGYCAWGMGRGYKAKVDPKNAWTLHDGKLYLNYNKAYQQKWLSDKQQLIKNADIYWQEFKQP